jgi:hypothetical protein
MNVQRSYYNNPRQGGIAALPSNQGEPASQAFFNTIGETSPHNSALGEAPPPPYSPRSPDEGRVIGQASSGTNETLPPLPGYDEVLSWLQDGENTIVCYGNVTPEGEFQNLRLERYNLLDDRGRCNDINDLYALKRVYAAGRPRFPLETLLTHFPSYTTILQQID